MKPILLFGGTFDPVHNGHMAIASGALQELSPANIMMLPAGNPYQRGRLPFAAANHRAAMLRLAFRDESRVAFDLRELHRAGPTYTIDTLHEWRTECGNTLPLVWLLGGDAFARLDTWHRWDALFALAHFAVVLRQDEPHPVDAASATFKQFLQDRGTNSTALGKVPFGHYAILSAKIPPVSSTDIRARRINGDSIRGLVPGAVCDYIEQHQLYLSEE